MQEIKNWSKSRIVEMTNTMKVPAKVSAKLGKKIKGENCVQKLRRRAPSSESCEQISAVITNKFSTRNEVRKRERVNPKVRPKGVRSYLWYLADGKPGGANKALERNGCCEDRTKARERRRDREKERNRSLFHREVGWLKAVKDSRCLFDSVPRYS